MLTLCSQTFEPVWTDFGGGVTRTREWRAAVNEMGEIPVLEEDGVRLTQTAPILLQLADRYGRFGGEGAQKFEIMRWLFWDNHKLTGYMATYRYLRTFTPKPDPHVLDFLRKRIDDYLSILDRHLQPGAFVVGNEPTVADISMMANERSRPCQEGNHSRPLPCTGTPSGLTGSQFHARSLGKPCRLCRVCLYQMPGERHVVSLFGERVGRAS